MPERHLVWLLVLKKKKENEKKSNKKNAGKNPGLAACVDPLSSLWRQLALRQRLSPLSRLHDRGDAGNVTVLEISFGPPSSKVKRPKFVNNKFVNNKF